VAKQKFEFISLETEMEGDRITARPAGTLAPLVQPFVERFINVLNSLKVIAKKNGANVYNLYNPPQPTKAGMRALERKLRESFFKMMLPATANLAVTHRCQCRCIHCSADPFVNPEREELTKDEIMEVVTGAQELGATLVIFTGGEPTMRKDLYDLIRHVDKDKSIAMIFTNGLTLERDAEKLAQAGLDTLNVSIDSADPEKHDRFRRIEGLYRKALAGAKRARECGILTGISTYATHQNLVDGSLERLIKIGQDEGFHEVTIFDCIPSGRFLKETERILTPDEKRQVADLARNYHAMDNPMGVVAQAIVNSPEGVGCFGGFSQFYMTAYGDINPCDFNPISFGNVRELPIQAIWQKMQTHPDFKDKHLTCRMQTASYRKKYIDVIPNEPQLPIAVEDIEAIAAGSKRPEDLPRKAAGVKANKG
jgi:MoaA/NifB/PqqE/SkfB family radical SAM enzyme